MSDATKREFPAERFDAVYSRETILHIEDKKALFQKILVSLTDRHLICFVFCKLDLNIDVPKFFVIPSHLPATCFANVNDILECSRRSTV